MVLCTTNVDVESYVVASGNSMLMFMLVKTRFLQNEKFVQQMFADFALGKPQAYRSLHNI